MNPALWRGCQVSERRQEMVPTSAKLTTKLRAGAPDSAKAGFHPPHTWLGRGFRPLFT